MSKLQNRVHELEDDLKQCRRRVEELRHELDEQRDLVRRMEQNVEDADQVIERWAETFDMVMTPNGKWTWKSFWQERDKLVQDYNDLVRQWNKYLPRINGYGQPVGRPLQASKTQCEQVLKLHKAGCSLRGIVDETSLGLGTVRTIIGQKNRTDRTTRKHLARVGLHIDWKRQKKTGEGLPARAQQVVETGHALLTEAKGLGRTPRAGS
jgi:hypothetical protein